MLGANRKLVMKRARVCLCLLAYTHVKLQTLSHTSLNLFLTPISTMVSQPKKEKKGNREEKGRRKEKVRKIVYLVCNHSSHTMILFCKLCKLLYMFISTW